MDFAVRHDALPEGSASWVLAVSGERLLMADNEGALYWVDAVGCKLARVATPDNPTIVAVVQPTPAAAGPGIVIPGVFENREMRRNGH